jgi:hypothetical protein
MDRLRDFGPSDMLDYDQSLESLLNDPELGRMFSAFGRYGALNNVISHLSRNPTPEMVAKGYLVLEYCIAHEVDIGLRCSIVRNLNKINPISEGFKLLRDSVLTASDFDDVAFCPDVALAGVEAVNELLSKPRWSGQALAPYFENAFLNIFNEAVEKDLGQGRMGQVASACGFFLGDIKSSDYSKKVIELLQTGHASGPILNRIINSADGIALNLRDHAHELVKFLYHPDASAVKAARTVLIQFDRNFLNRYSGGSFGELDALKADCARKYGQLSGEWKLSNDHSKSFYDWKHKNT